MASFFKTRFLPNPDGTDSATAISNANTAFVHTYIGDDLTGDGTREFPFKSVYKANQKSGVSYIVFRGVINESFSTIKTIIGDDINQYLVVSNYTVSSGTLINLTTNGTCGNVNGNQYIECIISDHSRETGWALTINKCLFTNIRTSNWYDTETNCTYVNFKLSVYYVLQVYKNSIVYKTFDVANIPCQFTYFLFSSSTIFKYNGVSLTQPTWTNDSKANIQLLRNAYLSAGMSSSNVNQIFVKDSFGNETCKIVKEVRNGGTSANIFNGYDINGNITDYSLNPSSSNEALYASDLGGWVGFSKPATALTSTMWDSPINVNSDGSDTTDSGTLVRVNSDQTIDFNTASSQIWNRLKGNTTIAIPNGIKFNGMNLMSNDGSAFGYIFGKYQNLVGATALTPSDALEANSIYKVCNANRDIYSAVIYNGNQYLPDYFFKTDAIVLDFSLLNVDSGTIVRKILASPLESVEIIPYDNATTPSATFPKFSCPLMGNVQMLFHKIGVNIDKPVLFSEVTNDKIAYYQSWAVTNADQEFVTLASDTTNYYYKIPVLSYLRVVLNGVYNQEYDQ